MSETFPAHLDYLFGLERLGTKLGLGPIGELLERCGNPEQDLTILQIAGTNGKGSTAAITARILQEHGEVTGLYTSPHLLRPHERIRINGLPVEDDYILEWLEQFREDIEAIPATFFEAITALALSYFRDRRVGVAILETGLGGRLDATTATTPAWTAITPIAMDHMDLLGDTLVAIAWEKAGILKPGVPCYSAAQTPEVEKVLQGEGERVGATMTFVDPRQEIPAPARLAGGHQWDNARLAWNLAEAVLEDRFRQQLARQAIESAFWPGRYQLLGARPRTIYDVAHNPHGAAAFLETLKQETVQGERWLVLALQEGKRAEQLLNMLAPKFDHTMVTQTNTRHFLTAGQLAGLAGDRRPRLREDPDPVHAIRTVLSEASPDDLVAIIGSHYLGPAIAEVFKISFDNLT